MTVSLWRIATDTPDYTADDMRERGAETTGGRWNRAGMPVVYAATNIALATLETIVHFNTADLPLNRVLVRLDVPEKLWAARKILALDAAPVGWNVFPAGRVSLDLGDAWLRSAASVLMEVPSAIVPEESNVLVNPRHPDVAAIAVARTRTFACDPRLLPTGTPARRKK
ncbi:RES family NAD+ phosphorylase [Xylophilus ampelinus]|uniref:RES domain-containing protein n=1 Tax=Xylophilus ampelinus TaxID=54067 RepID=A0A318SSP3_9BURK|nr:RES family NAD+ phosphorylase [Xylophilus ampelinus]MCS4510648.1 RES family NAD+ phosphorylase [Xylophilus ampelinus]PYE76339.1 RES domain-containing protein [Xylophilus ampelinus]